MKHYAVIGAGFGDEGKGLMTDYLCRKLTIEGGGNAPLNVRFNGGAQAGHTVVTEKDRHVFGHHGAGTFAGAQTYLSADFIVNPLTLKKEGDQLLKPKPIIHPHAKVTTVFDITLNAFREISRGSKRHGSCGMGINETVTRNLSDHELWAADLNKPELLKFLLTNIYDKWFLPTALEFKDNISKDNYDHYMELATVENELSLLEQISDYYEISSLPVKTPKAAVFEGAQGLELDEELGHFPHVTRSITGLLGAYRAAEEMGVDETIQPVYVTRPYKTRHGAGPLSNEGVPFLLNNKRLTDKTNVSNTWQQEFRYAPLNLVHLKEYIDADVKRVFKHRYHTSPVVALTHLDEIDEFIGVYDLDDSYTFMNKDELIHEMSEIAPVRFISEGETASHVTEI